MKQKSAFTLIELMIVMTIIGLLSAIAIPNLVKARIQANEASAQTTLKTIASSLENFYALNNVYPDDMTSLTTAVPPYLSRDYFSTPHSGYSFIAGLGPYTYEVSAVPADTTSGTHSYTVSTGSVLSMNP